MASDGFKGEESTEMVLHFILTNEQFTAYEFLCFIATALVVKGLVHIGLNIWTSANHRPQ